MGKKSLHHPHYISLFGTELKFAFLHVCTVFNSPGSNLCYVPRIHTTGNQMKVGPIPSAFKKILGGYYLV